jgi:arylsulfatase A-like enzyme
MSVLGKLGRYREFPRVRAPSINERLLRWLGNRPARPFFAFLNYFDVHEPYDPPPPFDTMYDPVGDLIWRQKGQDTTDYTPHELEQLRARYDGAIAYLDDQLGQLLQEMSSRGALENTVVIITSDHGEALGEHGGIGHFGLQWRTLHVPLVVLDPHGGPAGRRVEVPVSLRDLPATIADLVNLDDSPFPGTSLRWRWEMGSGDVTAIDPIMSEADGGGRSVVLGPWHYVDWPGQPPRLYDYGNDPLEERNLYDSLVSVDSAALLDSLRQVVRRSRPWQSP